MFTSSDDFAAVKTRVNAPAHGTGLICMRASMFRYTVTVTETQKYGQFRVYVSIADWRCN